MKNSLLLASAAFLAHAVGAVEFHVSPAGNDAHPGTKEQPFATLEKARDTLRSLREKGEVQATVVLAPGSHRRTKTFALDPRDSGTTFRGGDGVRLTGSVAVPVGAIRPVTDPAVLQRLQPGVRDQVLEVDLKALGVADFGEIGPRGFRRPYVPAPLELIVDDEPLILAQWPNAGEAPVRIGRVIDKGPVSRNGEKPTRGGVFELTTDRPKGWKDTGDIWITGIFSFGWADNTVKVKAFDLAKKTLATVHPDMYGFMAGKPWHTWRGLNILEEIDRPGEFMADKTAGKAYFLLPEGKRAADIRLEATVLQDPLVAIEGATRVVFDGVHLENTRGMGVTIERGADNRIQNATLRNIGMVAVCVGKGVSPDPEYRHGFTGTPISRGLGSWHEHIYNNPAFDRDAGTGHGIVNCHIHNIGAGAISLGGGSRLSLTPAGNFVENCDIHHYNRWDRTYKGAVNIEGVGNAIRHCHIHDGPALAIYLHGNDHLIEYNEINRVVMEGDDMGAFYMGRDATERGNIIRYNFWHHLAAQHMNFCLYFDDSGGDRSTVVGNVFYRAGNRSTVFIAGGSDFLVENNLFVDCKKPIEPQPFRQTHFNLIKQRMELVKYNQPPWSERYPEFAGFLEARRPRNNVFRDNLILKDDDPRLVDPKKGNFALKPGAETGLPNFKPIPFEKMGRQSTDLYKP